MGVDGQQGHHNAHPGNRNKNNEKKGDEDFFVVRRDGPASTVYDPGNSLGHGFAYAEKEIHSTKLAPVP